MADTNEFDDAAASVMLNTATAVRNNVYNAVPQNPAQVAQHAQIADQLGIPLASVQSDPNLARQQAAMRGFDANKVVSQYPHLAEFLTDSTNAAKSHNDLQTLAATEQSVKSLPTPAPASAPPDLEGDGIGMAAMKGLGGSFNAAGKAVNSIIGGFPSAYDLATTLITGQNPNTREAYNKAFVDPLDADSSAFNLSPNASFLAKLTHGTGNLVGTLSQIGMTGGMAEAPAMATGVADAAVPALTKVAESVKHAARSMAFPSLTAAVNTGNDVYAQTGSLAQAVKAAGAAYATNTAMGVMPLSLEGNLATRVATGFPVGVLTGEANRSVMNAALPGNMQQPAAVDDAIINGLTGSMLAGAMGHAPQPHETAIRQAYEANQKAAQATDAMHGLQSLGELAAKSELRKNDPQAFKDFVNKVTDDGHLPEVWIDGKTFTDALNQSGISMAELANKMPELAGQIHEALQTNGDLKIDTADYATHIAGTPVEAAILPHLKTDPEGMTFAQGQEHLAQSQKDMTAQAQELADKQAALDERERQLKAITDDVQEQVKATGRVTDDVARQYAALHRAFYDAKAEQMGVTPERAREIAPLPLVGAERFGGFAQSVHESPQFKTWFGDSKVVDAEGKPLVVYHGTKKAGFDVFDVDGKGKTSGTGAFFTNDNRNAMTYSNTRDGVTHSADEYEHAPGNYSVYLSLKNPKVIYAEGKNWDRIGSYDEWFAKNEDGDILEYFTNEADAEHFRDTNDEYVEIEKSEDPDNTGASTDDLVREAKKEGYDGVIFKDVMDEGPHGQGYGWGDTVYVAFHPEQIKSATDNIGDFDPTNPSILKQGEGNRGSYNPATNELTLLKDADLSTFLHESGHFFLEAMHKFAQAPEAPGGIKTDFDTLLKSFKVKGDTPEERMANWSARDLEGKREGHEQFADGFEDYLMTGKAPTPELQSMFSRFRSWLMSVYQSLRGEVSPEVRGVMDRMFASQEAINEAERVRAYVTPDLAAEHGAMIDEYKALGQEATEQAIAEMQARSMRDMKWLSNAKSKKLKDLQREAATQRREMRIEARRELMSQPIYQAWSYLTGKIGEADKVAAIKSGKSKGLDPEKDTLLEAIAKLGGISRDSAHEHLGVHADDYATQSGIFGKPVFRKSGGLHADTMAERLADYGFLRKDEHGKHDLNDLEERVSNALGGAPEHSMYHDYEKNPSDARAGEFHEINPLGAGRLDLAELKSMHLPEVEIAFLNNRGMTAKNGIHPDLVAERFGLHSGTEMVLDLASMTPLRQAIEGLTDQKMLERHGDLVDPVSVERAAEAAIHNEARAKMMATGLKMFTKSPMSVIEINKAAKAAADTAIAAKAVGELRPAQYSAAETKANKELLKLAPRDPMGAAKAQREALLNNRLFKSSSEAVEDVRKGLTYLKRLQKPAVRGKIDVDVRDQIDAILGRFDLRANPTDAPTRAQLNLEKWIESQAAAGYSPTVTPEMLEPTFRKPYREMSVEEFRGMVDTIKSMEHMGRERNTLVINGEKHMLQDYVAERIVPKLAEKGDNFSTEEIYNKREDRGLGPIAMQLDRVSSWLRGLNAQLKPQEFKRNDFDRHELLGAFGEAIFDPVFDANYNKVRMLKGLSDDFRAKATELGRDWQKGLLDMLPNDKLIDAIASKEAGTDVYMKLTRGKMVGLAIHVGNESNFDKLTKGYGWQPEAVWQFLHENMTAKDWEAVQHVWDLYEKHWPDMAAMYRRLGQTTPDKIEARAFKTPFGEMRGGYAAIKYDPLRSKRGEKDAAGQAINPSEGLFGKDYFSRTATTNGSMNKRIDGYTDAIDLNFHTIERSLQESIHDLAYREALINANKVIENSEFRKAFFKAYGREDYAAMQDWIGRIANSDNSDRNVGSLGRFLQYTRTGMVMTAIGLRATTVLKHGGSAGIKTMGYFMGGGEKYITSRMAAMGSDYTNQITLAKEKFGEINARLLQQDRDYRATASSMFEPESLQGQAERFGHAAVAWADMMTAVPTAWAAYDRAITEGIPKNQGGTGQPMTEAQAVAYANKIVREAHGSNVESARSNIMTAPSEAVKMFTTLYGFMNNSYGQMADSINKLQTPGMAKPEVLARTFMAIIMPALWAETLTEGLPKHLDDAAEWAHWAAMAVGGEVAAMVPVVRDAWSMAKGFSHAGVIGAESWMSTMVHAGKDVVHLAQGKEVKKPIQDIADAAGMGLHIPGLGQIGKSVQYEVDLHSGKVPQPKGTLRDNEAVNVLIGAPKKD